MLEMDYSQTYLDSMEGLLWLILNSFAKFIRRYPAPTLLSKDMNIFYFMELLHLIISITRPVGLSTRFHWSIIRSHLPLQ